MLVRPGKMPIVSQEFCDSQKESFSMKKNYKRWCYILVALLLYILLGFLCYGTFSPSPITFMLEIVLSSCIGAFTSWGCCNSKG